MDTTIYRYRVKEIKEEKEDKVFGIIELGMWETVIPCDS